MSVRFLVLVAALVLPGMLLVGCGSDDPVDGNHDDEHEHGHLSMDLGEWYIAPDALTVQAGEVEFDAVNSGLIEHEVVVLRTDLAADELVVVGARVDEEASGTEIGEIEPEDLAAGASASKTFDLAPGAYVLFCNIAGHYAQGMTVALTVE